MDVEKLRSMQPGDDILQSEKLPADSEYGEKELLELIAEIIVGLIMEDDAE